MELVSLKELSTCIKYNEQNRENSTESYVILNGVKKDTIISGLILEKCVRIYDYYLVFMTMDCPFEESLHVSLLDKNGKLLEAKDIFQAYYTDDFSDLKLYPPNIVTFDFLCIDLWKVEVYQFPRPIIVKPRTLLEKILFIRDLDHSKKETYWKVGLIGEQSSLFSQIKKTIFL